MRVKLLSFLFLATFLVTLDLPDLGDLDTDVVLEQLVEIRSVSKSEQALKVDKEGSKNQSFKSRERQPPLVSCGDHGKSYLQRCCQARRETVSLRRRVYVCI